MIHLKNVQEIEHLRASADLVSRTLAEVAGHIEVGVTTKQLDEIAEKYITGHNARPAFKGYKIGRAVFPSTLCTSVNEQVVHGIPGDYLLKSGDIISIDCGVHLNGYFGDSAYTFGVGELSEEIIKLCRVTYDSLYLGIEKARVGFRVGDISEAVQSYCESHGYGVVRDLVGHGIGRNLHEKPQIPNFGRKGTGRKLKEGLSICIEPMINLGTHEVFTAEDHWTINTLDEKPSAHYEHMVVVQKGEADILSTFSYIEKVIEAPYKLELTNG